MPHDLKRSSVRPHLVKGGVKPKSQIPKEDRFEAVSMLVDAYPHFTAADISHHTGIAESQVRRMMRVIKGEKAPKRSLAKKTNRKRR